MYQVYVLINLENKIYIGQTSDLKRRLLEHNSNSSGFTKFKGPWKPIHLECFANRSEAIGREGELKSSRGRHWIKTKLLGRASVG